MTTAIFAQWPKFITTIILAKILNIITYAPFLSADISLVPAHCESLEAVYSHMHSHVNTSRGNCQNRGNCSVSNQAVTSGWHLTCNRDPWRTLTPVRSVEADLHRVLKSTSALDVFEGCYFFFFFLFRFPSLCFSLTSLSLSFPFSLSFFLPSPPSNISFFPFSLSPSSSSISFYFYPPPPSLHVQLRQLSSRPTSR